MRRIGLLGLALLVLSLAAFGGQSARMGTAFSDTYGAFAPLVMLHRSYADYLFYGTEIGIPEGVSGACERTGMSLAVMQIELLSQTGSHVLDTVPRLARLRSNVASLCSVYSETLESVSRMGVPNMDVLGEASQLGLFSDIYDVQQRLQFVFETYLEGIPSEQSTWEFAVAFSLDTLLAQQQLAKIDQSLQVILYGSEEATQPPAFVPVDVADAILHIVEFIESPADTAIADDVRELVLLVYTYVLERP